MSMLLLIRHGMVDPVGRSIAGRAPGVRLNAEGIAQAERLGERLAGYPLAAVYCSPLERALETAAPLCARLGLEARPRPALGEMDFGSWTGRRLDELDGVPEWQRFNTYRSGTRIPGGELMLEVQARVVAELYALRAGHAGEAFAVVTHGDVIRAAIAHFAGFGLDLVLRIEIDPASVSVVELTEHGPRILRLNDTGELPRP